MGTAGSKPPEENAIIDNMRGNLGRVDTDIGALKSRIAALTQNIERCAEEKKQLAEQLRKTGVVTAVPNPAGFAAQQAQPSPQADGQPEAASSASTVTQTSSTGTQTGGGNQLSAYGNYKMSGGGETPFPKAVPIVAGLAFVALSSFVQQ